jgi:Uma2 family endonuclease
LRYARADREVIERVMTVQISKKYFTINEYRKMAEIGIISDSDRVELINGEIIEMTPIGSVHAGYVNRLNNLLSSSLGNRAIVSVQNPVQIDDRSEPEPDISVLKYRSDFYTQAHPGPEDILLIVEAADTSLDYDREIKIPLYAHVLIPEVRIVNLNKNILEIYRKPDGSLYQEVLSLQKGETINVLQFPDKSFYVNDILG